MKKMKNKASKNLREKRKLFIVFDYKTAVIVSNK